MLVAERSCIKCSCFSHTHSRAWAHGCVCARNENAALSHVVIPWACTWKLQSVSESWTLWLFSAYLREHSHLSWCICPCIGSRYCKCARKYVCDYFQASSISTMAWVGKLALDPLGVLAGTGKCVSGGVEDGRWGQEGWNRGKEGHLGGRVEWGNIGPRMGAELVVAAHAIS